MDDHEEVTRPVSWCSGVFAGWLVAACAVLGYANSWTAPFVYDDTLAIPQNPTIRRLWPLTDVLLPPAEGGLTVSGRPVLNLSFALNHAVSGTEVWSYHVLNTFIHAGAGLLLLGIGRRTLRRWPVAGRPGGAIPLPADALALAIAGLWTAHPLQTQAVTYTVQRAESLMGFFYLLTLYAFVRAVQCHLISDKTSFALDRDCHLISDTSRRSGRWLAVSVIACGLGMGTKEVMATAPLLVLLYDRTFVAGSFAAAWRGRPRYYLALAATWLLLGALVLSTGGNRGGTVGPGVGVPLWAYPLTQFKAVAQYLALSVWPSPLVFEYGTFWVRRAGDVLPYAAAVLPLLAATGVALWRWPAAGFLGAWFFGILAPTSLAPGTIQMIVEHRMYLPLAAVVTSLVWLGHAAAGRQALRVAAALALGCALLTVRRNDDYRSHLTLWGDTVAKRPLNPRAHEGLAEALAEVGRADEAIAERKEALRLLPDESTYHYNLALTLAEAGRTEDAIRHYEISLRLVPDEPRTHNNLAIALGRLGRTADAFAHYAAAVRLRPADAQYHYNYGVALYRAGNVADAVRQYQASVRLQPDHSDAHFNLATALMKLQRMDEALVHYREAVRLKPNDTDYRSTFGGALLLAGNPDAALGEFRAALAAKPGAIEARYGLGNALAARQQFDAAIAQYEAVLRLAPDHANAYFKRGNALLALDRATEAVASFASAVRLAPQDAEAHHNLGVACAQLERWAEAQQEFETALRLKPDYPEARRNLEQLRNLLRR